MFQGTGSDVGKSLIVAGLCRAFANRGLRVRPFKPQNMSNNAAVTADGGEIGRAQALQARACRIPASVKMNPVLLKPQSDVGSQVIVLGQVIGNAMARDFQGMKAGLLPRIVEALEDLKAEADIVLVEGAGSAAEVNLRANDIANMGFARAADVPVVLIGDIDRGGVIAQIVGTKARLEIEIPFNAPQGGAMTIYLDKAGKLGDASARAIRLPKADQYQLEGEQFSRVVRGKEKLVYGVEDAILQARVLDALFRSESSGKWEKP